MVTFDAEYSGENSIQFGVFSGFSVKDRAGNIIEIPNRKASGLLAYLALSDNHVESRQRLSGLFWSERSEEKARASLRQCLKQIRSILDPHDGSVFDAGRINIRLSTDHVKTDALDVVTAVERGDVHDLLLRHKRLTETLLLGFDDIDPSFRIWLLVQRQSLHDRFMRALEDRLHNVENGASDETRKHIAQAIVNLDPTHEEACQSLMRFSAENGDVSGALRTYNALWNLLDEEYDMEPSEQTKNLVAAIKLGEFDLPDRNAIASSDRRADGFDVEEEKTENSPIISAYSSSSPSLMLVVEEFEMSNIPEKYGHICDGFRHELISRLVRFREWTVVDGKKREVKRQRKSGKYHIIIKFYNDFETLNVVLTLMEYDTCVYVWSDRFGVSLTNYFESQKQVVRKIAAAMNINLSMERLSRISGTPDVSLDVYDRWLLGQNPGAKWRGQYDERSEKIFRSLMEDVPKFAPAYSSLVGILNSSHHTYPGLKRDQSRELEALSIARQAVQIDPLDTRSHLCLAWSHAMNAQYDNAQFHFKLARDLNTSDAWTLVSAALGQAYCGNTALALDFANEALQLDAANSPSHWAYHATIRYICKDFEGCVEAANFADDTIYYVLGWKASALIHLGRTDEAISEFERFLALVLANWAGADPPVLDSVTEWFMDAFPIRSMVTKESLRTGFLRASLMIGKSAKSFAEPITE